MSEDFKRQNSHKHKRVPESWRKPRGTHSPRRKEEKHAAPVPKAGYRGPKDERGLHPSGYEDVLVHNPSELDDVDPETEAVRIGSSVGGRKTEEILERAGEKGVKVLNAGRGEEE
ncbi:MAG: 50S ribosomal protein L32e [Candidatus Nanohaloarchaea archaeon]|nr:50S ribosomal protein L32e [Candidatus Nanohaloarchaea archaeon]